MVPFDKQSVTVVRQSKVGVDTTYEPPLRVGFGISDKTVDLANAVMGRTVLVPGAGPNPTHYHANNDVCWYIMSGSIRCIQARSDCSERKEIILEAGDFVYIPSGAIHVIANASQTEEASLVFCYIGVPNVEASGNVWLTKEHDAFVAPGPEQWAFSCTALSDGEIDGSRHDRRASSFLVDGPARLYLARSGR